MMNSYCYPHEDKNQIMTHLNNVRYSGFAVVTYHSFGGNCAEPLSARTLKSIRQRQEVNGIIKNVKKNIISIVMQTERPP